MNNSKQLFEQAQKTIPGGVNSPVRAFRSVGRDPLFIESASGCRIKDVEGREYIDYVGSWGPMILGHAHPEVVAAVTQAAQKGTSFGAPTEAEVLLAEKICEMVPSVEMVRMVNSGTEATMSALRLARGVSGRSKVIKFEGCYHGHGDSFLMKAGSGALTHGEPDSPGVPAELAGLTLTAEFNDRDSVQKLFEANSGEIAALIVEPIAGNMGVIPPEPGFLQFLREICTQNDTILIFDEVMTGFRVHPGGAQAFYGVTPDLTTLGKIVGGGLPAAAYGGKKELMQQVSPAGPVYQAGTLSGNPLAVAAGLKTLEILQKPGFYEALNRKADAFFSHLEEFLLEQQLPLTVNAVHSMGSLFFNPQRVTGFSGASASDTVKFAQWFGKLLDYGIYIAPSQFEALFVSAAHTQEDLDHTGHLMARLL